MVLEECISAKRLRSSNMNIKKFHDRITAHSANFSKNSPCLRVLFVGWMYSAACLTNSADSFNKCIRTTSSMSLSSTIICLIFKSQHKKIYFGIGLQHEIFHSCLLEYEENLFIPITFGTPKLINCSILGEGSRFLYIT